MSLSDPSPKLPRWIFFVTDLVLVAAGVFIATHSARPLSTAAVVAIASCVLAGGLIALVPLVASYEREKNEALAERQNALDALSRTVATSAEQISIAAAGLHEIADLVHRNLRQAEQLPHKLQEKIAEFQAQLDNTREDEREELEKELAELRAGEGDQLAAAAEKVRTAIADLARAETAAQKQLTGLRDLLAALPAQATAAHEAAATAAARQLADARTAAATDLGEAAEKHLAALRSAVADADTRLATRTAESVAALTAALSQPPAIAPVAEVDAAPAARRPRKSRRDDPVATEPDPTTVEPATAPEPTPESSADAPPPVEAPAEPTPVEPAPIAADTSARIEPVAPSDDAPLAEAETPLVADEIEPPTPTPESAATDDTTPPPVEAVAVADEPAAPTESPLAAPGPDLSPAEPAVSAPPTPASTELAPEPATTTAAEPAEAASAPKPSRKRAAKKEADDALSLPLPGDDFTQAAPDDAASGPAEVIEQVLSSDGATRLLVTAYIGIGNRLFVRGRGPGLSWEKGVPLQFVSIGKWRWETSDASEPLEFKLYKNDQVECTALGALTLEPGHQQEVAAKF